MSKVEARVDSWNCQGRTRTGNALKGMVKARLEEKGKIKAREEKDQIQMGASRAVFKVETDLGQNKIKTRNRHDRAERPGQGKAKPGRSMTG